MKTKKIFFIRTFKILVWILGFLAVFFTLSKIFQPKYFFSSSSESPETELWDSFYKEPENSIDVMFLGSSHIYNAVNPLVFYGESGLTGFDLASSSQDIPTSYFYMKEALQYQSPDYVILDTYGILYPAFSEEVCYKRSLDDMRWSSAKKEAIEAWQEHLENEPVLSRIFTISDYHTRWEDLTREDFFSDDFITSVNGYCPYFSSASDVEHNTFGKYTNLPELEEETLSYFDRLVQLCNENDMKLILISAPDTTWTEGYSSAIRQLASKYSLPFIDYNTDEMYPKTGVNDQTDWRNKNHLNAYGAEAFTRYLARYLAENHLITPADGTSAYDALWQEKTASWSTQAQIGSLSASTDLPAYLRMLKNSDYSVFIASKDEASKCFTEDLVALMHDLGFNAAFAGQERSSYYAVITPEALHEESGMNKLYTQDSFNNGHKYYISSAGFDAGNDCSIIIDDVEYALNKRGLNIVVYDNVSEKVIDSVRFDTHNAELTAYRK